MTLQAVKPSTHKKSTFTLPTKSGRWNFTAANGTLNLKGAMRVKRGKRSQQLGTLVFSRGGQGGAQLTVKVRGKKVKIFNIAKKGAKAKTKGNRQTVSKFNVTLTKQAATLLNKALMERALSAMADIPLAEAEKLSTLLLLSGFVRSHATLAADLASGAAAAPPAATYGAILSQLADDTAFPAVHRAIASGSLDDEEEDPEADFEFGLARILDGVQSLIALKRDDGTRT